MSDRTPPRDSRKIHVPAPGGGRNDGPPPRVGSPGAPGAAGRASVAPPGPLREPIRTRPPGRSPKASKASAAPAARERRPPDRRGGGRARRFLPDRPKLRRVLLLLPILLPLLLLTAALGTWLYGRSVFNRIEKVEVSGVLSTGGNGTNYLVVGSDSRDPEAIAEAGLNPEAFGTDDSSQRSDTMLLLRFADGEAKLMSIPRDLYVPIAETDGSGKINAAYHGGPRRLILTVQQALDIPIHHYMEVDFVSFASLVDALGGVTIDFPYPAFDNGSGLQVDRAGPVVLDGPQALAYVRSRNYTEVIDGENRKDPTADLGRVTRQQQFLRSVFSKLGESRNPITLARAASSASDGLRIDDGLGLTDAARLAWRMRSLDPVPVVLPVEGSRNRSGDVLLLVQPGANAALAQFR
ncbi:MAG: LCP family protein [Acidimicrobiales bacterium]|nr:LCP family protein [Acidimicrobiales bacterium]